MIFISHKLCLDHSVGTAELDNQDRVDNTNAVRDIPWCYFTSICVRCSNNLIYIDEKHLKSKDKAHKEKADWYTIDKLSHVTVLDANFLLNECVLVNRRLTLEIKAFLSDVLIASYKPLVGNIVLFSFPTFMEHSDPNHHNQ